MIFLLQRLKVQGTTRKASGLAVTTPTAKDLISGSDPMGGVMTDAIIATGMDGVIGYVGGGSGVGEKALVNSEIGMTAMSRAMKPESLAQAQAAGVVPLAHIVGLERFTCDLNKTKPPSKSTAGSYFP